jgi:hypothetical protein
MPTIAIFFGIIVEMYWLDHNPPHIHVWYQGEEAMVSIETGEITAGHLPRRAAKIVKEWVLRRQPELIVNWERGRQRLDFNAVPGADVDD